MPELSRTERKLAAIMFLDMVGYTRLMQENEAEAVAKRDRHREVLRREVAEHGGEILQYWGDGTLCLFGSAVEAVHCAADIQRAMQEPPEIPLRIGIHLGDVSQDEEGLYGDGVNIAARIESLSVPGAVLISKTIRNEVRNQEAFDTRSMGSFSLKNVAEPVEVFAVVQEGLIVPQPKELEGKGTSVKTTRALRRRKILGILGLVLAITALAGYIWIQMNTVINPNALPAEIREEKLAILPFENQTGDPALDPIGPYVNDAIAVAFESNTGVELVSPDIVDRYINYAGYIPDNPENEPSFNELTGARYLLNGSYYRTGEDSIEMNIFLTDAVSGNVAKRFPKVTRPIQDKKGLAGEVSQFILGYWRYKSLASSDADYENIFVPNYQAAIYYEKGMEQYLVDDDRALEYFEKALAEDPDFKIALMWMGLIHFTRGLGLEDEEVQPFIEDTDGANMIVRQYWQAFFNRNKKKVHQLSGLVMSKDPGNFMNSISYSNTALALHKPALAVKTLESINMNTLDKAILMPMDYNYFAWLSYAYNQNGQFAETVDLLSPYDPANTKSAFLQANMVRALIREDEIDQLESYIDRAGRQKLNVGHAPALLYLQAAWDFSLLGKTDFQEKFAMQALKAYEDLTPEEQSWYLPYAHLLAGNLTAAEEGFLELENRFPGEPRYQAMLGMIYARLPEQNKATRYYEKIRDQAEEEWGWKQYWMAVVQANRGEKAMALELLKEADKKGYNYFIEGIPYFFWNTLDKDIALEPLFDYPPFQEFVEPKG